MFEFDPVGGLQIQPVEAAAWQVLEEEDGMGHGRCRVVLQEDLGHRARRLRTQIAERPRLGAEVVTADTVELHHGAMRRRVEVQAQDRVHHPALQPLDAGAGNWTAQPAFEDPLRLRDRQLEVWL